MDDSGGTLAGNGGRDLAVISESTGVTIDEACRPQEKYVVTTITTTFSGLSIHSSPPTMGCMCPVGLLQLLTLSYR